MLDNLRTERLFVANLTSRGLLAFERFPGEEPFLELMHRLCLHPRKDMAVGIQRHADR